MKDYNEIAREVLRRRDERLAAAAKKRAAAVKTASAVACFCIVAFSAVVAVKLDYINKSVVESVDSNFNTVDPENGDDPISAYISETVEPYDSSENSVNSVNSDIPFESNENSDHFTDTTRIPDTEPEERDPVTIAPPVVRPEPPQTENDPPESDSGSDSRDTGKPAETTKPKPPVTKPSDTTGRKPPVSDTEESSRPKPPATEPPVTEPPVTEPPVTEPPVTEPPVTEPPVTEPPVTEPPVTEPPVTEPPVTEPPVTEPPVTEPPVTEPPVTEPPVTEPPVTEPPVTEPPVTEQPRPPSRPEDPEPPDLFGSGPSGPSSGNSQLQSQSVDYVTKADIFFVLYTFCVSHSTSDGVVTEQVYSDVPLDRWYSESIAWAFQKGITHSVPANIGPYLDPFAHLERQDLACYLYALAGSPNVSGSIEDYSDFDEVESYAVDAMTWCIEKDILCVERGKLLPDSRTRVLDLWDVIYVYRQVLWLG